MKKLYKYIITVILILVFISVLLLGYVIFEVNRKYPDDLIENYKTLSPSVIYDINGNQ